MKNGHIRSAAAVLLLAWFSGIGLAGNSECQGGPDPDRQQTRACDKTCTPAPAPSWSSEIPIDLIVDIRIAPRVLVLGAPVPSVTVHADIPFALVADAESAEPVALNGMVATRIFPDDCGDLVAKFAFADIEQLAEDAGQPKLTLVLTGATVTGETFGGEAVVSVRRIGRR